MRLKGGHQTSDPRLDRIPQFDDRSRRFPIRALIGEPPLKPKRWRCDVRLDQGREGACVGFGWSAELAAEPKRVSGVTDATALALYHRAQQLDEWPGESYDGTSVLAGAKAVQELGRLIEYRWAFGIDDVLATLSAHGPVVFGVNWYEGMFDTTYGTWSRGGFVRPTGRIVGGHCILGRGITKVAGQWCVVWRNSWGRGYGDNGDVLITADDLARLLNEDGEACVPVLRS